MRLLVIDGNYLMIDCGWLDFECICRGVLFGFLKGKYFPVFKLKGTPKKSVSTKLVSILIDSPSSLNKLIMSFLNLSTLGPLALCTITSPSPLWKYTLLECNPMGIARLRDVNRAYLLGLSVRLPYWTSIGRPFSAHCIHVDRRFIWTSNGRPKVA